MENTNAENSSLNMISIDDLFDALSGIVESPRLEKNVMMKDHTSFHVGGPVDLLIRPASIKEAVAVMSLVRLSRQPLFVMGNGSNLLVRDKGIRGVVVKFGSDLSEIAIRGDRLRVQSGALMSSIAKTAYEAGLTGFEFASGIPGSIGGGLFMNAGAYGGELKDVVTDALVIDYEGNIISVFEEDMELLYRSSVFKDSDDIIVEVGIQLSKGNKEEIAAKMNEYNTRRNEKQPMNYPSAGSTFKRPQGNYAGKLIQEAGCMGLTCGDAQVSEKHAGFIINRGKATAADIIKLMNDVVARVKETSGITLEPEVLIVGEE